MSAKVSRVLFISFCILIFFFADLFLLPGLALRVEKQKLSEGLEEMKTTARNSHNRAEEVITRAEEELVLAKFTPGWWLQPGVKVYSRAVAAPGLASYL